MISEQTADIMWLFSSMGCFEWASSFAQRSHNIVNQ